MSFSVQSGGFQGSHGVHLASAGWLCREDTLQATFNNIKLGKRSFVPDSLVMMEELSPTRFSSPQLLPPFCLT